MKLSFMKNLQKLTQESLAGLSEKQREVLERRYGLSGTAPATLDQIGKKMGLTRERIRQIESSALETLKTNRAHEIFSPLIDQTKVHLVSLGGVRHEDFFFDEIIHLMGEHKTPRLAAVRSLEFAFSLAGAPARLTEDTHHHPAWYINKDNISRAKGFISALEKIVKRHDAPMDSDAFGVAFKLAMSQSGVTNESAASYYLGISKKFKFNPYGDFGLSSWPEIEPKGMREKAYLVMKKSGSPMHFSEISNAINTRKFDTKVAQPQTVHNELIKDKRFVLCGRGIYGLREWGIEPGTVKDILVKVLKSKGPLPPHELVGLVGAQRKVKDATILLGLQDKTTFMRLEDGRYKFRTA
jgi:hypothetical protein